MDDPNVTRFGRHVLLDAELDGQGSVIRCRIAWRAMPDNLPPWFAVYEWARDGG